MLSGFLTLNAQSVLPRVRSTPKLSNPPSPKLHPLYHTHTHTAQLCGRKAEKGEKKTYTHQICVLFANL